MRSYSPAATYLYDRDDGADPGEGGVTGIVEEFLALKEESDADVHDAEPAGAETPGDSDVPNFCQHCGTDLREITGPNFCPHCGTDV